MNPIPSSYAGKCIAFVDDEIVASGSNSIEAYQVAQKKYPHREITLMLVPTKRELVTFL